MLARLRDRQASGDPFVLPGLASTSTELATAKDFMGKGPYRVRRDGLLLLYEFCTAQAKNVTELNPDEAEWILAPNREFTVLSVSEVARANSSATYYHVLLHDVSFGGSLGAEVCPQD